MTAISQHPARPQQIAVGLLTILVGHVAYLRQACVVALFARPRYFRDREPQFPLCTRLSYAASETYQRSEFWYQQ